MSEAKGCLHWDITKDDDCAAAAAAVSLLPAPRAAVQSPGHRPERIPYCAADAPSVAYVEAEQHKQTLKG